MYCNLIVRNIKVSKLYMAVTQKQHLNFRQKLNHYSQYSRIISQLYNSNRWKQKFIVYLPSPGGNGTFWLLKNCPRATSMERKKSNDLNFEEMYGGVMLHTCKRCPCVCKFHTYRVGFQLVHIQKETWSNYVALERWLHPDFLFPTPTQAPHLTHFAPTLY